MSLIDFTTENHLEVVASEVESLRFGYRFGRCSVPIPSPAGPAEIVLAIERHDADITVLRYPADRLDWFHQLSRRLEDYVLLYADTLIYWELTVGAGQPSPTDEALHVSTPSSAEIIADLTGVTFVGYPNHYRANPLLSPSAVEAGYQDWALRTPLHDALVLFRDDSAIGLATMDLSSEHIEILLAGLIPTERGKGRYSALLEAIESRAREASLDRVVISTQTNNTGVQRAWARYGFRPLTAIVTTHVIRKDVWLAAQT